MSEEVRKLLRIIRRQKELSLDDDDLKWLIELSQNDYLAWIAIWLACMIGEIAVLVNINNNIEILSLIYWGLVAGTILSVWITIRNIRVSVSWMRRIRDKDLRMELLGNRGFSELMVDKNGKTRLLAPALVTALHVIFPLGFFLQATEGLSWFFNAFFSVISNPLHIITLVVLGYSLFIIAVVISRKGKEKEKSNSISVF